MVLRIWPIFLRLLLLFFLLFHFIFYFLIEAVSSIASIALTGLILWKPLIFLAIEVTCHIRVAPQGLLSKGSSFWMLNYPGVRILVVLRPGVCQTAAGRPWQLERLQAPGQAEIPCIAPVRLARSARLGDQSELSNCSICTQVTSSNMYWMFLLAWCKRFEAAASLIWSKFGRKKPGCGSCRGYEAKKKPTTDPREHRSV